MIPRLGRRPGLRVVRGRSCSQRLSESFFLGGTIAAVMLLAACTGPNGGHDLSRPADTALPTTLATPSTRPAQGDQGPIAAARSVARDEAAWRVSAPEPTAGCVTPRTVTIRSDIGAVVSAGHVHATGGSRLGLADYKAPFTKTLWVVDQQAGAFVRISIKERTSGAEALFYYPDFNRARPDSIGSATELHLEGPFERAEDAARGYVIYPVPGCYDITAKWDGGTGAGTLWVYYDPEARGSPRGATATAKSNRAGTLCTTPHTRPAPARPPGPRRCPVSRVTLPPPPSTSGPSGLTLAP